jgi:uncharacterized Rmd1/YagE family protein
MRKEMPHPAQDAPMRQCSAQCLANVFDFDALKLSLEQRYRLVVYLDVIHIEQANWEAFVFPYGVFVGWGMGYDDEQFLLEELRQHSTGQHETAFVDRFTYTETEAEAATRIHNDHIELSSGAILNKLTISHGLAQSVKLMEFENQAQRTIEETSYIPENIAQYGRANLGRKAIAKLRGTLYLVRSDIHLHFDLLDTPEFFWEYPELQDLYHSITNYLEIEQRTRLLTDKLDIIQQLLNMLAEEQNHKHSSTLEWIIIWLIAVEIVAFFVHDIFKLF